MPSVEEITNALRKVIEPELHKDLVTLKMVEDVKVSNGNVESNHCSNHTSLPIKVKD